VQDVTPVVLLRGELGPGIPDQPQAGRPASLLKLNNRKPQDAGGRGRTSTPYNRALEALSRRSRSTAELRRWLIDRKYEAADVDDVIERLSASGLLDDAKYAEQFARNRLLYRKLSKRRVLGELTRRGIARELAAAAVAQVMEDEGLTDEDGIQAVAARKWRTLAKLDPRVAKRRLMGFLARRGYDGDAVRRALEGVTRSQAR
jgi:regulatory protein